MYTKCASTFLRFIELEDNLQLKLDHLTQIIFDYEKNTKAYNCENKTLLAAKENVINKYKTFIDSVQLDLPKLVIDHAKKDKDTKDAYKYTTPENPYTSKNPLIAKFLYLDYNTVIDNKGIQNGKALDNALCKYIITDEWAKEGTQNIETLENNINDECGDYQYNSSLTESNTPELIETTPELTIPGEPIIMATNPETNIPSAPVPIESSGISVNKTLFSVIKPIKKTPGDIFNTAQIYEKSGKTENEVKKWRSAQEAIKKLRNNKNSVNSGNVKILF
jgi:hypothetical protein